MDREKPGTLASRTPIRESQQGAVDMGASDPAGLPDEFWSRVGEAPHRLLMFDYDGTLAPLRNERSEALPYPGAADRLRSLVGISSLTIAMVIGRLVHDVEGCLLSG